MVATAVVLLAVVGAIVFVMRMDEDPNRWARQRSRAIGRHRRTDEAAARDRAALWRFVKR